MAGLTKNDISTFLLEFLLVQIDRVESGLAAVLMARPPGRRIVRCRTRTVLAHRQGGYVLPQAM